ncbi:MAG: RNA methyltransferase [Syntrophobacterales bacterium]|jgi:TrmH family RNA methyltransferase|nr:RNA methyltransferase [Syntrophobacterales bacterium]
MFLKPSKGQLKFWSGLNQPKKRQKEGFFIAEGIKVVQEILRSGKRAEYFLVREDKEEKLAGLLAAVKGSRLYLLSPGEWKHITQDKEAEGIAALMPRISVSLPAPCGFDDLRCLLLYQIGNPANLGAIFRTAHWFGITSIFISENSVDAAHPKAIRASMGSVFHLRIWENLSFPEILSILKERFVLIATTNRKGQKPHPLHEPSVVILGSESHGLPEEILSMARENWCIPHFGDAESLSLPQAAAIILYEWTQNR